jgi:hypothetical protein
MSRRRCVEQRIGTTLRHPFTDVEKGLDLIAGVLAQAQAAEPLLMVVVWIKAFIPRDVPGYSQPAPGWGDATMISDPWIPGCWLTDNRGFDNYGYASARMTSMVAVSPVTMAVNQLHYCDVTVRINCGDGAISCQGYGDASRMTFSNPRGISQVSFEIDLLAAESNPCPPLGIYAPDIDYRGTIYMDFRTRQILFQGYLDQFPAFEMYAMEYQQGSSWRGVPMFNTLPPPGAGPSSLFGGANRPQIGFAQI